MKKITEEKKPPQPEPDITKTDTDKTVPVKEPDAEPQKEPEVQQPQNDVSTPAPEPDQPVNPPPPALHVLKVESDPPGAAILLDGKETGQKTPFDLSLEPGTHQVELRLDGYQPAIAMPAELALDSWKISMKPIVVVPPQPPPPTSPGKIAYAGEYPVSIYDNRKLILDTQNSESAELPAGTYKLTLVATGKVFIRQNVKIQVKPGETTTIPAPSMSQFSLTSTPSNCNVYIDTVLIDVAPIFDFPIQAGNHHIRVQWEKLGKEKSAFITVPPDKPITLRAIADDSTVDVFEVKSQ